jgi:glucose-6-phosphate 1-dehydrogenase
MTPSLDSDEPLICRLNEARKPVGPCSIIIFGASGDLASRKLVPALYHLFKDGQMPPDFRIIGVARREKTSESWARELREALDGFSRSKPVDETVWTEFARRVSYSRGDFSSPKTFVDLSAHLNAFPGEALRNNLLFYLAAGPDEFGTILERLHSSGLLRHAQAGETRHHGFERVIVEKPFGHDLESARGLNAELTRFAGEHQVFRIDHYLGKETVQNILMFRFSNAIFERLWNRDVIDHVQITVSEKLGVGQRGGYYERVGALRDMVQNHLLQVFALVAMEPPVTLDAEAIRDEKVKLLRSIRPMDRGDIVRQVARGQYRAGMVEGKPMRAYREEEKAAPDSNVETFVALRLLVDNWRWSGVPFYLRTGKALPSSASEVRVQFRPTPYVLFAQQCGQKLDSNSLTIRLQPDEGIALHFNGKAPGTNVEVRPVRMDFSYDAHFGAYTPEAYERLLLDAMTGDATLFIRRDEVETAWEFIDNIRGAWNAQPLGEREFYAAGTWGPQAAENLIDRPGHAWRQPRLKQK